MKAANTIPNPDAVDPMVVLNDHTRHEIEHWLAKFPPDRRRSATIAALRAAQEQNHGHLTDELITAVANYLKIPQTWAYEVASFYSQFHIGACGRNKVSVCTNVSCWLNGAGDILAHVEKKYGIKLGGSSADGKVHLVDEEECLAACVRAPMMTVNGYYHENLTIEKVDAILDGLS
jgi:NADH-quinone oxidoreductase subunit E